MCISRVKRYEPLRKAAELRSHIIGDTYRGKETI